MRIRSLKLILIGSTIVATMNSCVPLAVGAAGVAVGYIARDEGVGVVEPVNSNNPNNTYDSYNPAVY